MDDLCTVKQIQAPSTTEFYLPNSSDLNGGSGALAVACVGCSRVLQSMEPTVAGMSLWTYDTPSYLEYSRP